MNLIVEKKWQIALGAIALLVIISGAFSLGVSVGVHRAGFSRGFGDNYYRNFAGGDRGFDKMRRQIKREGFGMMGESGLRGAFGLAGELLSINDRQLTINDRDGIEKVVIMNAKTLIRRFSDTLQAGDLKSGDFVVVVGEPNQQGQIEAKLVRVMPVPGVAGLREKSPNINQKATTTLPSATTSNK